MVATSELVAVDTFHWTFLLASIIMHAPLIHQCAWSSYYIFIYNINRAMTHDHWQKECDDEMLTMPLLCWWDACVTMSVSYVFVLVDDWKNTTNASCRGSKFVIGCMTKEEMTLQCGWDNLHCSSIHLRQHAKLDQVVFIYQLWKLYCIARQTSPQR